MITIVIWYVIIADGAVPLIAQRHIAPSAVQSNIHPTCLPRTILSGKIPKENEIRKFYKVNTLK